MLIMTADELESALLSLKEQGAHNINFVTPSHYFFELARLLERVKPKLDIPIVCNCGGYESKEGLAALDGLVDVYLPDFKYVSSEISAKYSHAPDYFEVAMSAIEEMLRQRGKYRYFESDQALLASGVLIRHLVLPSHRKDSIEILTRLSEHIDPSAVLLSIMSQYTPDFALDTPYTELHRKITSFEYSSVCDKAASLGFVGFTQSRASASKSYTPDF